MRSDRYLRIIQPLCGTCPSLSDTSSIREEQNALCTAQLPPLPHILRRQRALIYTANCSPQAASAKGGSHTRSDASFPFLLATDSQFMHLEAAPQRGPADNLSSSALSGCFISPFPIRFTQFCRLDLDSNLGRPYQAGTHNRFP